MSKIIKIYRCGPLCPRFLPIGELVPQTHTISRDIACYDTNFTSGNFWIIENYCNRDRRGTSGFPSLCQISSGKCTRNKK